MARNAKCIGVAVVLLAAQHIVAQDVLGKMLATDAIWSAVKKESIHSHLQRMLQMDAGLGEPAIQEKAKKVVTYGPMTQEAFERMAQRKRAALREQLKKAGTLTAELDAFLQATPGGQLKDAFGIPLPIAPSAEKPRPPADFEMKFDPQAPAPVATTSETKPIATKAPKADFDMTFEPQTPAMDPSALRRELDAFIAASSALQGTTRSSKNRAADVAEQPKAEEQPKNEQPKAEQKPKKQPEFTASGPARPPMTEQEAERLAAQQAANAAARDAALARKKHMVREEAAASSKKAKLSTPSAVANSSQQPVRPTHAALQQSCSSLSPMPKHAKWGVLSYLLVTVVAAASLVGLFAAAAVLEDVLVARKYNTTTSLPLHWLAVTRSLWRRVGRAFVAARKQLTGHGSDLPMSVHEGTGPVARAFAASSAFVHVFWSHLVDHRGQHLSSAVAAAVDASRRASAGGVAPDRTSSGGAVSPFAAPQYQQSFVMEADLRRRH